MIVPIKLLHTDAKMPTYATDGSAGMDLYSALPHPVVIRPLDRMLVPCGFVICLPQGFEAQIRPRSGLAFNYGVTVLNAPGTIDSDYRGEVGVILINLGKEDFFMTAGMRIAQMVIHPVESVHLEKVEVIDETSRGKGGFGSTGTV